MEVEGRQGKELYLDGNGEIASTSFYEKKVIAKLFGVTIRRIEQMTQEGIIETTATIEDGKHVRRYALAPTVNRCVKNLSNKARGRKGAADEKELKGQQAKEQDLKEKKLLAEIALKESQGELHRLKTAIAMGEYISLEEIKMDYSRFFVLFRKFALSLPSRLVNLYGDSLEPTEARRIEKELGEEVMVLLGQFVVAGRVMPETMEEEGAQGNGRK